MITIDSNTKVKDIIEYDESLSQLLFKNGLDVCCGGNKPFLATCAELQISSDSLIEELKTHIQNKGNAKPNEENMKLDDLVNHILSEYHDTSREIIMTVESILPIVIHKHGGKFPFLNELGNVVYSLFKEYSVHLLKEEQILFPYIFSLLEADKNNLMPANQMCGKIYGPINVMRNDHEQIDQYLKTISSITNNFTPPEGACNKFRLVYQNLEKFYQDTQRHVNAENNILFTKAIKLEEQVCR